MFGSRKKEQEELYYLRERISRSEEIFNEIKAFEKEFEAERREVDSSSQQMSQDFTQISEHARQTAEAAQLNVEGAASVIYDLNACNKLLEQKEQVYQNLKSQLHEQAAAVQKIVEENKHFTSPSKYLSEVPADLRDRNKTYLEGLQQMESYGKQMGVLALNAAIEAGRLGESGQQFVLAAEEIRLLAGQYGEAIQKMQDQLKASEEEIGKLEQKVHKMVILQKDNNVAASKLMKQCNTLEKKLDSNLLRPAEEAITEVRKQVIGFKNAGEEMVKAQERSRIIMDDITEEFAVQQKIILDMEDAVAPIFEAVQDFSEQEQEEA